MPMMADLEDPPKPRTRGLVIGVAAGIPVVLVIGLWFLPALHAQLVGDAKDFDARLRNEDAYMQALCFDALVVDRDEGLCGCALAAEFPSLDCRSQFMAWSLDRQSEQCGDPATRAVAVSFCACVDALQDMRALASDETEARRAIQRYARCAELGDAIFLPTIERLADEAAQTP